MAGSYDVTAYGHHYTGSFSATVCGSGAFQGDVCSDVNGGSTCTGTPPVHLTGSSARAVNVVQGRADLG